MPRCGLWLYGMGRPQQGHASKYCRPSGTGENDTIYLSPIQKTVHIQSKEELEKLIAVCPAETRALWPENRVATYANLVVRLRVLDTKAIFVVFACIIPEHKIVAADSDYYLENEKNPSPGKTQRSSFNGFSFDAAYFPFENVKPALA